jgi:hypothetical protein
VFSDHPTEATGSAAPLKNFNPGNLTPRPAVPVQPGAPGAPPTMPHGHP